MSSAVEDLVYLCTVRGIGMSLAYNPRTMRELSWEVRVRGAGASSTHERVVEFGGSAHEAAAKARDRLMPGARQDTGGRREHP